MVVANGHAERRERIFPPAPSAVGEARRWIRAIAGAWELDAGLTDRLVVGVSELAANAILHAGSPFRVVVERAPGHVYFAVDDASTEPPIELHVGPYATSGRGFALVRSMSDESGVEARRQGKRVWADLEVSS